MTGLRDVYKCNVCGHVVEIVNEGQPTLVCCGQPMVKLEEKTADQGLEKHVPVVEDASGGVKVKVGSVAHPMEEKHYIKFIEVETDTEVLRSELKPGQAPEAVFCVDKGKIRKVREYCIIHDLWKA
ncbi:MAG: desulfoferrodoxin [Candidatus Omnitrophica bacterium]|nr:desulfoferrodoxin [Candidatus Omnitrophota bacterium]MDD5487694.1 desulfoferrodoxin [Candidatus Omnitrophota bacterium]